MSDNADLNAAETGDIYRDEEGQLWEITGFIDQPCALVRPVHLVINGQTAPIAERPEMKSMAVIQSAPLYSRWTRAMHSPLKFRETTS